MSMSVYLVLMNQKVMKHVIKLLQEVIQLPLQIDSSNFQALKKLVVIIMENHLLTLSTGR